MNTESRGAQAQGHWIVLGICVAALLGAVVLAQLASVEQGMVVGGRALPGICAMRNATGLPCAGCGLTRSWVALAQGDLQLSLHHHRLGWLVMLYVLAQALRHGAWLALSGWRARLEAWGRWLDRGIALLLLLLIANWVLVLLALS